MISDWPEVRSARGGGGSARTRIAGGEGVNSVSADIGPALPSFDTSFPIFFYPYLRLLSHPAPSGKKEGSVE